MRYTWCVNDPKADMSPPRRSMTEEEANTKSMRAAQVFSPRTPVNARAFFAGRWSQMNAIADAVSQVGLHVVIFGERGVGKSSLANIIKPLLDMMSPAMPHLVVRINANNQDTFSTLWAKALDEVRIEDERPVLGFTTATRKESVTLRQAFGISAEPTIDEVRRTLARLPNSVFVIDEFDRLSRKFVSPFTDLIKALSDSAAASTVVLVGVADTVDGLVKDHTSIPRALVQIHMPRMSTAELGEILLKAGEALGMTFDDDASARIARMSQGLPHYTHLVGQHAVRNACERRSYAVTLGDVDKGFAFAVKQADHTIADTYATATHSAHSAALFSPVLLACAITACRVPDNALGYFQAADIVEPLETILDKDKPVQIATFNGHLTEFISDKRSRILERTGTARAYRYRFHDPLVPPYVILRSIADKLITAATVETLLNSPTGAES